MIKIDRTKMFFSLEFNDEFTIYHKEWDLKVKLWNSRHEWHIHTDMPLNSYNNRVYQKVRNMFVGDAGLSSFEISRMNTVLNFGILMESRK